MTSTSNKPRPIRAQSLRTQVYDTLRERIQQGGVNSSDRLVDLEIASELGVSRMPVREALLQLTHEGYLVGTTRGFMLPNLTHDDMREIFEVRKLLEPRAAAMAARDIKQEQLLTLALAHKQAEQAHQNANPAEFILANSNFRQGWLDAVANGRLADTINRFADHVQTVRFGTLQSAATQEIVLAGLDSLLSAFQRHDVLQAQERMERFLINAEDTFFGVWDAQHALED